VAPASAFLPGLFHDVGRIAFLLADADGLDAIEGRFVGGEGDRIALEIAQFGVDHAEAGAILAEDWGLSPAQADAIRHHHAPEDAGEGRALATILGGADALAHELGYGTVSANALAPATIGLSADAAAFCRERVRHAFEIQNALLA
jgi:HD-like signal output (HDOD) protein